MRKTLFTIEETQIEHTRYGSFQTNYKRIFVQLIDGIMESLYRNGVQVGGGFWSYAEGLKRIEELKERE